MPGLIRFLCGVEQLGIFTAAYALRDGDEPGVDDRRELDELLRWFEENLPQPTRFVKTTSKGHYRREPVAISWFKDDAAECIGRAWRLVWLLERNGRTIETIRTTHPGYVTYQDEQQVTAIPFSDR